MDLKGRHFLKLMDYTPEEITYLLDLAADLKDKKKKGIPPAHSFSQQGEYFRFHISVSAPLRFLACLLFSEFITK